MKIISPILLAGLIAGWFASTAAGAPPDTAPATAAQPSAEQTAQPANPSATPATPAASAAHTSYANLTAGTAGQGLILNMRGVTIDRALDFLTKKVGFPLIRQTSTRIPGSMDVVSDDPYGNPANGAQRNTYRKDQ